MKLIDADSLIEHAEVNCESVDFVEKLIDYVSEQEEVSISQGHEEDLVSRKMAIDVLSMMQGIVAENGVRKGISMAWQQIKDLPSAQVRTPMSSADCISRQAAIDAFDLPIYNIKGRENAERVVEYLKAVIQRIKDLPSAQPEIIQCKDCKHWTHIKRTKRYWCRTDDGLYDLNPSPDDFCSRAERRTDG